jgi:predicted nucleotidyltransferase
MQEIIEKNLDKIIRICQDRKVMRLAAFGSARFDPEKSDLDLLVEFVAMTSRGTCRTVLWPC